MMRRFNKPSYTNRIIDDTAYGSLPSQGRRLYKADALPPRYLIVIASKRSPDERSNIRDNRAPLIVLLPHIALLMRATAMAG
jgi:hypothetical protein